MNERTWIAPALCGVSLLLAGGPASDEDTHLAKIPSLDAAASEGFFFAGGNYVGDPGKEVLDGAMFVEVFHPRQVTQRYPLVFFHGAAQTGLNWLGTPDGRKSWAQFFLEKASPYTCCQKCTFDDASPQIGRARNTFYFNGL